MSETPRTTLLTANRGAPASSSTAAGSPADSDLSFRVAALESDFSRLSQTLPSIQMPGTTSSSGFSAQPVQLSSTGSVPAQPQRLSSAGPESARQVQSDAAMLGQLQAQIDALKASKADKADLEGLQLRAAAMPAGTSIGNSKSGDSGTSVPMFLPTVNQVCAHTCRQDVCLWRYCTHFS